MKTMKQLFTTLLLAGAAVGLAACGGGAGGTGGGGIDGVTPTISISLTSITASPTNTLSLSAGQAARARAVYKTASGQAIANAVVTFALSDATLVSMSPANGTAITDAAGVAIVDIVGKTPNPGGALSITAKAANGADTITSPGWNVAIVGSTVSAAASASVTLKIIDSLGATVTNQTAGSSVVAKATVLLADGTPVANQLVNFKVALDSTLVTMAPASGNALTDASGVASVTLLAKVPSAGGPYSIEATGTVATVATSSGASNIKVGSAALTLGVPALIAGTQSPLPASSVATIQIPVSSNGVAVPNVAASAITASSPCSSQVPAKAVITVVGVNNGVATVNYQNLGCTNSPDTVTISMQGAAASAVLSIPVSAAAAAKLTYIGATPTSNVLVVKGAGGLGRVETGVVSFKLEDISGSPVANQTLAFELNTIAGGITLSTNAPVTDSSGIASVRVNSGTLPTPLTVLAKAVISPSVTLSAASSVLSISAGPPEQRSMSLSVEKQAIEGWAIDGQTSAVTMRMADYWGNAVPNQTAVSFISEGASISNTGTSNGSCLTVNGECTVTFRSQNFRPTNGRVSITAYAEGIEGYVDANGNGIFDAGENCYHSGAPFLNNDESYTGALATFTSGDLRITNISPSADSAKAPTACASRAATYVFAQTVIVLSSAAVNIAAVSPASLSFSTCSNINFIFSVADVNGNSVPQGSTVAIADSDKVSPGTVYSAVVLPSTYPSSHQVLLKPDTAQCGTVNKVASFNVVVTTPSGLGVVKSFSIPY